MSMDYWGIIGYGIEIQDIYRHINKEKVNKLVRELNPNLKFEDDVFDDDTFIGNPYNSFAEFLCELDKNSLFTYDTDGHDRDYFMYAPVYPWAAKKNEPSTEKECKNKMINILQQVVDLSDEEISKYIHYINDYGCS